MTAIMPRRSNHHRNPKKASNQKSYDLLGDSRNSNRRSSNRKSTNSSHSTRSGEDCEPRRPVDASRESSLDRVMQSSGSDTLDGGSPIPLRPPSPLPNHDNINSGPWYCLKITVYEMTHKGRQPLPVRLWMASNVKHMRGDLDIATVQILNHISSVPFMGPSLRGPGLLKEEARACQEGFTHYMDWQGLTIEREIHPLTLGEGTAKIGHYRQEVHGNHIPFKLLMGLSVSPATYLEHCQKLLRSSSSERSQEESTLR